MRVLDVGAGAGAITKQIWPNAEIVTVDLNPETEPTVVADCRQLPDDIGEFDAIMASHILEHLPRHDSIGALQHWAAHLKPGGWLHILVPDLMWAAEEMVKLGGANLGVLQHLYGSQASEYQVHYMGFTVALLRDAMERAGLIVQEATTTGFIIRMERHDGSTVDIPARQIYVIGIKPMEE